MRKTLVSIFILAILISGCTLPNSTSATETPDLIATQVNTSLTQQAAATKPASTTLAGVTPSLKPVLSVTLPPTQQPSPTVVTATIEPTKAPTKPPSATATLADLKSTLGKPVWSDKFADGKSWGLDASPYDDGETRVEIKNSALIYTSFNAKGWLGWRVSYPNIKDFYLEATIQVGTCSTNDLYGLVFRSPDQTSGYWFGITCDGRYYLRSGDVNGWSEIAKLAATSEIVSGSNQTNRLGVWVKGNKVTLYINSKKVNEYTDSAFPDSGKFGLFIAGSKTPNFTFKCTEIAYWNIP